MIIETMFFRKELTQVALDLRKSLYRLFFQKQRYLKIEETKKGERQRTFRFRNILQLTMQLT